MSSLPLHPVMVHLPLALALLMPLVAAVAAWAIWGHRIGRRAWLGIVALQFLLVSTSVVAIKTGEREEDRVEAVVPEAALHQHEEYAEQFAWGGAVVLGLALVVLVPAATRVFAVATVLGTLAVGGLALRVGHAGGELVYVHNAGAAYKAGSALTAAGGEEAVRNQREDGRERPGHREAEEARR